MPRQQALRRSKMFKNVCIDQAVEGRYGPKFQLLYIRTDHLKTTPPGHPSYFNFFLNTNNVTPHLDQAFLRCPRATPN